jgi:hypothetical protein
MTDADLPAALAEAAAGLLLDVRASRLLEGWNLADAGDRLAGDFIVAAARAAAGRRHPFRRSMPIRPAGSARVASGSSTRSTAPAKMRKAARIARRRR